MKIVILADAWQPLIGGGQKLLLKLATGLVKDHHCQITLITRQIKHTDNKIYSKNELLLGGKLKIIRLGPPAKWSNLFARIWFTLQSAIYSFKLKPNIFLASTFLPGLSLQLIKLFNKTPQVLLVIGFGANNFFYSFLENLITKKFNYNLLITDDYNFYTQVKATKKIKLIFNGVDLPDNKPSDKPTKWPNFTFLFVGRNESRKGVHILKKAFDRLQKTHPDIKLKLFGPGFNLVSDQQLHQELFKAHCLVLPSLKEGHPLILFEAWAHQLPIIATDVGSVGQFVNPSNGYLIPAHNQTKLYQAMKSALNNPQLSQLGQNGYQLVAKQFFWEQTVNSYYQALKHTSN